MHDIYLKKVSKLKVSKNNKVTFNKIQHRKCRSLWMT